MEWINLQVNDSVFDSCPHHRYHQVSDVGKPRTVSLSAHPSVLIIKVSTRKNGLNGLTEPSWPLMAPIQAKSCE
jgi:hypothetical protein